ncbi:DUF732 domain-containing protein [Candidatus Mycobacterium wuenschmannii]|uniref:DUF732 domain-containing protein n=1 Tax=Candidatus Mycobacterium wuenschmannii TaxID=3027808 RepID=A0ABY8W2W1_9MYCO|nr:DUF732 domain-containing protein [Candidatus Mycobacterium wuenschmannii]WIM89339.1 DUF732 domain-containing protein [Candidatus Mycobacterium wuenschmannii]
MTRRVWPLAVVLSAVIACVATPVARAVPAPDIEFIYDTTVRKQYSFANTTEAIDYAHGICNKITGGAGYGQVIGDVKRDVLPNDEYSANYLISNAVNIYCPAQLWQLRNSAGTYVPPPG